ncbi:sensor histidine kinase [Pseudodesulfovibrio cashew]|uniref:sensor histidine kinase n=1 Tax=Pseudodesulfovibrio cashew TaxID=2678688 RepID=UPI00131D41BF|nr:ATP-binding protein [Pseudodesulfovibrio cashew]
MPEEVKAVSLELKKEFLIQWLDAVPTSVFVVNKYRQIVHCNQAFRNLSLKPEAEGVIGLRPGEALNCVNSTLNEAGCGCSRECATCGAAQAIVKSLGGEKDCQNCRLTRLVEGVETPLDLQVFATPIEFRGQEFAFLFALDISHELRLKYLNNLFHHGLINTVGGIATVTEFLEDDPGDMSLYPMLADASRRILRDVVYHRDLEQAEQGTLAVSKEPVNAGEFFSKLIEEECRVRNTEPAVVDLDICCDLLVTDKRLLRHVVRDMLVNALEARESCGEQIQLDCLANPGGGVIISMTNCGDIPGDIRTQVFKRYVSTKSRDRGLGAYVMKLLTERYLGGAVGFSTGDGTTTFTVTLP